MSALCLGSCHDDGGDGDQFGSVGRVLIHMLGRVVVQRFVNGLLDVQLQSLLLLGGRRRFRRLPTRLPHERVSPVLRYAGRVNRCKAILLTVHGQMRL